MAGFNFKKFLQGAGFGIIILSGFLLTKGYFLQRARATLGPGIYGCGIRINPEDEELPSAGNGWTYSMKYRIFNVDNPDGWWKFEFWKCLCPEGQGQAGGACLRCEKNQEIINLKRVAPAARDSGNDVNAVVRRFSLVQPGGGYCGSFQFDAYIIDGSVRDCVDFQGGRYGHAWSLFRTNIDCGQPTPTPSQPVQTPTPTPTCPTLTLTPTPTGPVQTPTPTPTQPVQTPTPTPPGEGTPTPTLPERKVCYIECGSDSDCTDDLKCQEVSGVKRCVNTACSSESDCTCNRGCWEVCGHDNECSGGQSCRQIEDKKRCVPNDCQTEAECCAQPTPQVLGAVLPSAGWESFSGTGLAILGLIGAFLRLMAVLI